MEHHNGKQCRFISKHGSNSLGIESAGVYLKEVEDITISRIRPLSALTMDKEIGKRLHRKVVLKFPRIMRCGTEMWFHLEESPLYVENLEDIVLH